MRSSFPKPAGRTGATHKEFRQWLARHRVDLARAGIDADLGWAFPIDGSASAEWISFETPRLLGRIVLWDQGRYETTVALRRDGRPYVTEQQDAASAEDLDQALVLLVDHLRTDRDPGPWWQAPLNGSAGLSCR